MNQTPPRIDDITAFLQQELGLVDTLCQLLERETEALRSRDSHALQQIIHHKLDLMQALEQLGQRRRQWLGQASGAGLWRQWLAARTGSDEQVLEMWQAVEGRAHRCRELNLVNEKVLHRSRQTVNKLLGIMRGESADGGGTYTAKGISRGYSQKGYGIQA